MGTKYFLFRSISTRGENISRAELCSLLSTWKLLSGKFFVFQNITARGDAQTASIPNCPWLQHYDQPVQKWPNWARIRYGLPGHLAGCTRILNGQTELLIVLGHLSYTSHALSSNFVSLAFSVKFDNDAIIIIQ